MNTLQLGIEAMEQGFVPDSLARMAIRRLCRQRLAEEEREQRDAPSRCRTAFHESLRSGPIALVPDAANRQHYELPAEFFTSILGPHRKYSCCFFPNDDSTLADAEEAALETTCRRAQLADGKRILELGCGWGSLTLWMAERFPNSRITALSNSHSQRQFIARQALLRGFDNLQLVTADMNDFVPGPQLFDRVVSVEMFEHMRNYRGLLERIASWLTPGGKLFVHIFCHRVHSYPFECEGAANWMGRYFFTGGCMPAADLLEKFDRNLRIVQQDSWNGRHYQRTAEAWLANLDARRCEVLDLLAAVYGACEARRWLNRWRIFLLAVAELFGFAHGNEWFVSHSLMERAT